MSPSIANIALALSKIQGTVGLIPKGKTATVSMKSGGSFKYSYADLADIWDGIRVPLMKNELAISQVFVKEGEKAYLQTILIHSSGEWIRSILELDSHEKIQELGSEITYLRRYGISSILGIAADEDEDGQAANNSSNKSQKFIEHSFVSSNIETEFPPYNAQPLAATRKLTDKQASFLNSLIKDITLIDKDHLEYVKKELQLDSLHNANPKQFDLIIQSFKKRISQSKERTYEPSAVA